MDSNFSRCCQLHNFSGIGVTLNTFDQELTEKQIEESKDLVYKLDDILFGNNRSIRQIDYFFHTNMSSKISSSDENFATLFWNLQNDLSGIHLIDFEASYIYSSAISEFDLELFDLFRYDSSTLSFVLAQAVSGTFSMSLTKQAPEMSSTGRLNGNSLLWNVPKSYNRP